MTLFLLSMFIGFQGDDSNLRRHTETEGNQAADAAGDVQLMMPLVVEAIVFFTTLHSCRTQTEERELAAVGVSAQR